MSATAGKVRSVNVGGVRQFEYGGRPAQSAIWKSPAPGRIAARGVNLEGDRQADRKAHGGPDKAVYAYAAEDVRWWEREIGRSLSYGEFGENLTTEGIEVNDALVGERWGIGTAVFEVSEPRVPCWRLAVRMNDKMFPRRFTEALRPGTYLRIVVEGDVGAGDEIRVVERPDHVSPFGMSFASMSAIGMRWSGCLGFPRCPTAGRDGRSICFKKHGAEAELARSSATPPLPRCPAAGADQLHR